MKRKPIVITAIVVVVIAVAAAVAWPIMAGRMGSPRKPGSLMGEWTADIPGVGASTYKWGTLPRSPRLGFGPDGKEIIVAWLKIPGHPRPLPTETIGKYVVGHGTLTQIVPDSTDVFSSFGLDAARSAKQTVATSRFILHGEELVLTQPQTGRSVRLTLTAAAIPPSSPAGAGPGGGAGKRH